MVVIRLSRAGATHRPFYHIVVADSRTRRDSKYIERIGYLNYYASGQEKLFELDVNRLEHWVGQGAVVRPSVNKLVRKHKRQLKSGVPEAEIGALKEAKSAAPVVKKPAKAAAVAKQEAKPAEAAAEAKQEAKPAESAAEEKQEAKPAKPAAEAKPEAKPAETAAESKPEAKPVEPAAEAKQEAESTEEAKAASPADNAPAAEPKADAQPASDESTASADGEGEPSK